MSYGIPFLDELNGQPSQNGISENVYTSDGTNGRDGTDGTSHQVSLDDLINDPIHPDISKACHGCGTHNWKFHENGGGPFCAKCHPGPDTLSQEDDYFDSHSEESF